MDLKASEICCFAPVTDTLIFTTTDPESSLCTNKYTYALDDYIRDQLYLKQESENTMFSVAYPRYVRKFPHSDNIRQLSLTLN